MELNKDIFEIVDSLSSEAFDHTEFFYILHECTEFLNLEKIDPYALLGDNEVM